MLCASCGRPLTGDGRYCSACGAPQADPLLVAAGLPAPPARAPAVPDRAELGQAPVAARVGEAPAPVLAARVPFPGWAVALILLAVLGVAAVVASILVPALLVSGTVTAVSHLAPSVAPAADVPTGVRAIREGVETWRLARDSDVYPPDAEVTPARLGRYVHPWPQNPYTGGPMSPTGARGDYTYVRAADGLSYELTGFGADGAPVISLP
jgi:hypothetical protein